jgi:hypothetical protein
MQGLTTQTAQYPRKKSRSTQIESTTPRAAFTPLTNSTNKRTTIHKAAILIKKPRNESTKINGSVKRPTTQALKHATTTKLPYKYHPQPNQNNHQELPTPTTTLKFPTSKNASSSNIPSQEKKTLPKKPPDPTSVQAYEDTTRTNVMLGIARTISSMSLAKAVPKPGALGGYRKKNVTPLRVLPWRQS